MGLLAETAIKPLYSADTSAAELNSLHRQLTLIKLNELVTFKGELITTTEIAKRPMIVL
jgi:hypothetical protein